MSKIISFFERHPFFVVMLPCWFVYHGFTENYDLIPAPDAFQLAAIYTTVSLLLFALLFLFYKHARRAALIAFLILAINFFFGPAHDLLKKIFPGWFVIKYSFLLPFFLIFILIIMIISKKRKWQLVGITLYLNSFLIIAIITDIAVQISKSTRRKTTGLVNTEFFICDSCKKPDIYLIVSDGYAGNQELKDIFSYDNSGFENQLRQRGFYVAAHSKSNYNFTPFSIASMLSMNYLTGIDGSNTSKKDMSLCYNTIKKNELLSFFERSGYDFRNYSIFDFDRQPSVTIPTFLPRKTIFITSQTLIGRLQRDLSFHLVTTFHIKQAVEFSIYKNDYNNKKIISLTKQVAENHKSSKFVYSHLLLPHYPYYFDSSGKPTPENQLGVNNNPNKEAYESYLVYANKILLDLIDHIFSHSQNPPIVILMGDHGFREFTEKTDAKYYFMNLDAIYFPDRNYSKLYDSISLVNQFRIILNSQFNQHLSLLKDSTSFLGQ